VTEPAGQESQPLAVTEARPDPAAASAPGDVAVPEPQPGPGGARPDPAAPTAGSVAAPEPQTRRARLFERAAASGVPLAAILTVAGVAVAVYLAGLVVYRLRQIVLLVVVAGFVALLLNPLVVAVQNLGDRPAVRAWHLGALTRRGVAVGVVTVVAVVVFVAMAFAFAYPLVSAVGQLVSHLNRYVASAEKGQGFVGHLVRKYHVASWVKKNGPKLQSYAKDLAKPALSLTKGAATLLVAFAAIFMLVLLTLLEAPKMRAGLLGVIAPRHREQVVRVSGGVTRSVTGYMFGNLLTSLVAGVAVFVTMLAMGLPYAPLWGLWVALVDFLPMIGGALAGIPAVLFALIAGGVVAAVVLAVIFLVYTQVENHVLNPIVMSRTVHISPLLVLVAVLVGAEFGDVVGGIFGGFVGTLLAIPVASTLQVLVQEIWRQTRAEEPIGPVP
jgi:predicted PurR-regulated permease PerM